MTDSLAARLDYGAIRARADAATEGPWHAGRGATSDGKEFVRTYEQKAAYLALSLNEGESDLWLVDNDEVIPAATGDGPKAKANAEFIAHARTDVPALLDENARLRAALDRKPRIINTTEELDARCRRERASWTTDITPTEKVESETDQK